MFETAELGKKVGKKEFKARALKLREHLLDAQREVRELGIPVVVVFGGVDGAGKGETANLFNEWMDPRGIQTRAYIDAIDGESHRPEFWRYWRDLPARGQVGIFISAWYSRPLVDRVYGADEGEFQARLQQISEFERMLADDGTVVIKFWMHLSKKALKKRLKGFEKDPLQSWRVGEKDWRNYKHYDEFVAASETLIMKTSTGRCPWHLVEGTDPNYRALKAGSLLLETLHRQIAEVRRRRALAEKVAEVESEASDFSSTISSTTLPVQEHHTHNIVLQMDLSKTLEQADYKRRLKAAQAELGALQQRAVERNISLVCVFEGVDAAGKGGAIRRLVNGMAARHYRVIPIAAPNDEELAHHYLWRFWRHLPPAGFVTIFDRSWYGRVLVERVEGYAKPAEWRRAYNEINHFEHQLTQNGIVVVKFWLQISEEEQLRRFDERANTPYKSWKLTDEDWRNRDKWPAYANAVHDMIERTSTHFAPWHLVEGEDKRWARVKVVETARDELAKRLEAWEET